MKKWDTSTGEHPNWDDFSVESLYDTTLRAVHAQGHQMGWTYEQIAIAAAIIISREKRDIQDILVERVAVSSVPIALVRKDI